MDRNARKILVVVDIQNDFITGSLRNREAIKTLPNIVDFIKSNQFDDVYVTMDTHSDKTYLDSLEGQKLPVKHCIENTPGWEMPKEIHDLLFNKDAPIPNVFTKGTFGSIWMSNYLRANADSDPTSPNWEFTIIGFCTDICVVSNALLLRANFPNNKITVRKDCVAGVTPETNEAALLTMKMCQIEVI